MIPMDIINHSFTTLAASSCVAAGAMLGYCISCRFGQKSANLTVTDLFVYPIKGCGGIRVSRAKVTARGFEGDRMLMIVTEEGKMQTQRQLPVMAKLRPYWSETRDLVLTMPHCTNFELSRDLLKRDGERRLVTVWRHVCPNAIDLGDDIANWLSAALGKSGLRLVRMPDDHKRTREFSQVKGGSYNMSFVDTCPISLANDRSREAVRQHAGVLTLSMERFRPNIVVNGPLKAFEENQWSKIAINGSLFCIPERIPRCQVPRIDQSKGVPNSLPNKEPTTSLEKLSSNHFAISLVPKYGENFVVSIGDALVVHEKF